MTKTSLNLPYLVLTGVMIVSIVAGAAVIYPVVTDIQELSRQTSAVKKTLAERRLFLQSLDKKISALEERQSEEKALGVTLPNTDTIQDALRLIDQMASSSGVTVAQVENVSDSMQSVAKANAASGLNSGPENVLPLGVYIKLSGTYPQIRNFIDQVEKSIRLSDISSISLTKPTEGQEQLTANVTLRFYMFNSEGYATK